MSLCERLKDPRLFRQQAFIAGSWVDADGGATVAVTDPATGFEIGTVPALGAEETRRAVKAAEETWPAWRSLPSSEARLLRVVPLCLENIDDLPDRDDGAGKPLRNGRKIAAVRAHRGGSRKRHATYGDTIRPRTAVSSF